MNSQRGVYFLANDKILELAIAFLNSFRKFNPDIPLCLIPYDANFQKIASLSNKYNFSIYPGQETLNACDQISTSILGNVKGYFRKLALWEGPFDEFIYIDSDTVVLKNVEFCFQYLSEYDFITSHSNIPSIRKWVWKDSIYKANILSNDQINYAANTGYIISHRKALPLKLAAEKLTAALKIKNHMELWCADQPFLNYLFVTSGKYTSLLTLYCKNPDQKIPLEQWGGGTLKVIKKDDTYFTNEHVPILLIHWAGVYGLTKFEKWVYYKLFKILGIKREVPVVSFFMPNKRLWNYYRHYSVHL